MGINKKMTIDEARQLLKGAKIKQSYLGKPGCGCGCRGTYKESGNHARRISSAEHEAQFEGADIRLLESGDELILSFENERKYIWFYIERTA